jgi:hypothetical protein
MEVLYAVIILALYDCLAHSLHYCPEYQEIKTSCFILNSYIANVSLYSRYTTFPSMGINFSTPLSWCGKIYNKENDLGCRFVGYTQFFISWMAGVCCFKSVVYGPSASKGGLFAC